MIVLLSGGIAVGKTTVAETLALRYGGLHVRVRTALAKVLGIGAEDRLTLQREGAALDSRTEGRWLRDYLLESVNLHDLVVIDAIRTHRQAIPLLETLPDSRLVHLLAHASTRRVRYGQSAQSDYIKAGVPFDLAGAHETERAADELRHLAELELATDDMTAEEVVIEIAHHLDLASS